MQLRTGIGFDSHPFSDEGDLRLGGIAIKGAPRLQGVSDADALLHAISDALLGAASLGDIGELFPPEKWKGKNLSSTHILRRVSRMLQGEGWEVVNLDCVIVCERIRLKKYLPQMRDKISQLLSIPPDTVNIKVKSSEGMGINEKTAGIMCWASALIRRKT